MKERKNIHSELVNIFALAQTMNQLTIPNCSLKVSPEIIIRLRILLSNIQNKLDFRKEYWCYNIFQRTAIESLSLINSLDEISLNIESDHDEFDKAVAILYTNIGLGITIINSVLESKDLNLKEVDPENIKYSSKLINSIFTKLGYNNISSVVLFWKEKASDALDKNDINSLYKFFSNNEIKDYDIIVYENEKKLNNELGRIHNRFKGLENHKFKREVLNEIGQKRFKIQKDIQESLSDSDYSRISNICENSLVYKKKQRIHKDVNLDYIKEQIDSNSDSYRSNSNEVVEKYLFNLNSDDFNNLLKKYDIYVEKNSSHSILDVKKSGVKLLLKKGFDIFDIGNFLIDLIKDEFSSNKIVSYLIGSAIDRFLEVKTFGFWTIGKLFYKLVTI